MSRSGQTSRSGSKFWLVGALAFLALIALGIGAVALIEGIEQIGPAVRASEGKGIHGYFVARTLTCTHIRRVTTCTWSGVFERADGTITRSGVGFQGSHPAFRAGTRVPAVDTGDPFSVYQPVGSAWLGPAGSMLFGSVLLAGVVVLLAWAWRRRRPAPTGAGT